MGPGELEDWARGSRAGPGEQGLARGSGTGPTRTGTGQEEHGLGKTEHCLMFAYSTSVGAKRTYTSSS